MKSIAHAGLCSRSAIARISVDAVPGNRVDNPGAGIYFPDHLVTQIRYEDISSFVHIHILGVVQQGIFNGAAVSGISTGITARDGIDDPVITIEFDISGIDS